MTSVSVPRQGGQLFRYLLVGGANFVVSWSMLWCFTEWFGWPYLVSTAVAFLATTLFGHRGNRFFTFGATDQSYVPQLLRYAATMLSVLGLSLLLMWVLVELVGLHYLLANVGVAVILAVLGFWANSRWVFAQRLVATTTNSLNRKNLPTHLGNGNE